jgi:hypothetical protein
MLQVAERTPSSRVSIGSSESAAGSPASQPSSTGHIVVRPASPEGSGDRVGKEDRVDQLGLAARELGDEGQHELLVGQPLAQRRQLRRGRAAHQVALGEIAGQVVEPARESRTPAAERVETDRERRRHATTVSEARAS